jgi:murein hydrolase activator
MIINDGDNYHSLIAHADQLFKNSGDTVRIGEIVATVGSKGSLDGPKVYFEIRKPGGSHGMFGFS